MDLVALELKEITSIGDGKSNGKRFEIEVIRPQFPIGNDVNYFYSLVKAVERGIEISGEGGCRVEGTNRYFSTVNAPYDYCIMVHDTCTGKYFPLHKDTVTRIIFDIGHFPLDLDEILPKYMYIKETSE